MDRTLRKSNSTPQLPVAALAALRQGNKIEAIKLIREQQGIGLKEAKDRVDDYLNSQPARQSSVASAQSEAKRRSLLWLALIVAISLLAYYFLSSP